MSILNYKQFIINLNNYLKDGLPNAPNYARVSLAFIEIADRINDFFNDHNSQFFYNQCFLMALEITETKLFKEPKEVIRKSFPK